MAVLILRLFLGFAFMMHGSQKLLGAFGGGGIAGVAGMLSKLGLEPSQILAWVLSITEFVGGVCVFLGFLTRFWAAGLVIDMAVAIFKVHIHNGFFAGKNGFEVGVGPVRWTAPIEPVDRRGEGDRQEHAARPLPKSSPADGRLPP